MSKCAWVAIVEAVIIALLAVVLLRGPAIESTTTTTDSTRTVETDTTEDVLNLTVFDDSPVPTDTVEVPRDTVIRRTSTHAATSECSPDTVYVRRTQPVVSYDRAVSRSFVDGTITTVVRGEMLEQSVQLSVTRPTITTHVRDRIETTTTKITRGRLEILGAGGVQASPLGLDVSVGGGIRLPGVGSVLYQYGLIGQGHQLVVSRPILSL